MSIFTSSWTLFDLNSTIPNKKMRLRWIYEMLVSQIFFELKTNASVTTRMIGLSLRMLDVVWWTSGMLSYRHFFHFLSVKETHVDHKHNTKMLPLNTPSFNFHGTMLLISMNYMPAQI